MTTKEKILLASLELFNEKGLPNISLRNISDHLGISPGNLTYHFKKKDELEEALYFELVEKMNVWVNSINVTELNFDFTDKFSEHLFENFYTYRFIFIDIVHLTRTNEKIKTHYQQLLQIRKMQFLELIKIFIQKEILRPEKFENEYTDLYTRLQVFSDFYISSQLLLENLQKVELKKNFIYQINQMITPFKVD